jgi:IclR family transcriptional regulator, acetate operon repressor
MQSADRALAILAAFNEGRQDVGVSELAAELGMHKSTASRLLATLEGRGLVRRVEDRFVPGWELARLGALAMRGFALVGTAREGMERLAHETGETVNLAVRDDGRALNVHQVNSAHFVGVTDWTGRAAPLHATANGKVLLAFGDGGLPRELTRLTRRTITDRGDLRAELDRVRREGVAVALEELELGLHAVAAPVFDCFGACVAAISVSGPAYRLTERRLVEVGELCVAASNDVSTRLGYRRAA